MGKIPIPKDSETSVDPDKKKEIKRLRDLNEVGYKEILLSIDTSKKEGRIAFDHV